MNNSDGHLQILIPSSDVPKRSSATERGTMDGELISSVVNTLLTPQNSVVKTCRASSAVLETRAVNIVEKCCPGTRPNFERVPGLPDQNIA